MDCAIVIYQAEPSSLSGKEFDKSFMHKAKYLVPFSLEVRQMQNMMSSLLTSVVTSLLHYLRLG
jgi:hypothetical protein